MAKTQPATALAIADELGITETQLEAVREQVKDATVAEALTYVRYCQSLGADPFARMIFAFKGRGGLVFGASIDYLRARADGTGVYTAGPTEYETGPDGKILAAHVTVKKLIAGQWMETTESAYMDEFQQNNDNWRRRPRVMISKCAESRALRRAFPAQLARLYEKDEILDLMADTPAPSGAYGARHRSRTAQRMQAQAQTARLQAPQAAVEAEVEVVPPGDQGNATAPPAARLWREAKEMGATGADVQAAAQHLEAPDDSATWTDDICGAILAEIERMRGA